MDQSIDTVTTDRDSVTIVLDNRGKVPMPVLLAVTRVDGKVDRITLPADIWLRGERRKTIRIAREPVVRSIEVDPAKEFPDLDRSNQVWPR
jgi:hypothetical protein